MGDTVALQENRTSSSVTTETWPAWLLKQHVLADGTVVTVAQCRPMSRDTKPYPLFRY